MRVAIGALMLCAGLSGQAQAAELAFEGESMTPSTEFVSVVSDAAATNGQAMRFLTNHPASKTFTSTTTYKRILLRLRGAQCGDPPQPQVAVELDSPTNRVYAAPVDATSSYVLYEAFIEVPAGTHTLYVHMTNDFNQAATVLKPACSRDLWLDTVALKGMPRLFAADSYVNAPLAADAPIDAYSALYRSALEDYLEGLNQDTEFGVNAAHSSTPVYVVPAQQARVKVIAPDGQATLQAQWNSVPLPPGAQAADAEATDWAGSDQDNHLVVYQPETDTLWEFYKFRYNAFGQPAATFGGRMTQVSQNPGHFTDPPTGPGKGYGASATSIPLLAGLQRIDELQRGSIDHVVMFQVANANAGFCRWPAQRSDGTNNNIVGLPTSRPIPEGLRFRFPASLDIDAIPGMTNYGRMVARAVQRYGMVLTDRGGVFAFEAEDPTPTGQNPYPAIFEGQQNYGLAEDQNFALRNFPWGQLQALAETGPRPAACPAAPPGTP